MLEDFVVYDYYLFGAAGKGEELIVFTRLVNSY